MARLNYVSPCGPNEQSGSGGSVWSGWLVLVLVDHSSPAAGVLLSAFPVFGGFVA